MRIEFQRQITSEGFYFLRLYQDRRESIIILRDLLERFRFFNVHYFTTMLRSKVFRMRVLMCWWWDGATDRIKWENSLRDKLGRFISGIGIGIILVSSDFDGTETEVSAFIRYDKYTTGIKYISLWYWTRQNYVDFRLNSLDDVLHYCW